MKQTEKVLALMLSQDKAWTAVDLLRASEGTDLYVGYETSPRMSDLARQYPDMFETGRDGKYRTLRIKRESAGQWYPKLPHNIQATIRRHIHGHAD